MSNSSGRIREKFREEIRSRQIQEIMRVIREKANHSEAKGDCFWTETYRKVKNSSEMGIDMQFVEELISYLDQYPDHPNTYVLIEEYVQMHSLSRNYFFLRVLSVYDLAKQIPNYKRCLLTFLLKNEPIEIHILKEYDQVGSELIKYCQNENDIWEMLAILSLILSLDYEEKEEKFFPLQFMSEFFNTFTYFWDPSKLSTVNKYIIMNIIHCVGEEYLDHPIIKDNFSETMNLLKIGISEYPKHRSSFLSYFKILMFDNFDAFEDLYKRNEGKELMREVIYTYRHEVSERLRILEIYQYIVKESEFESLISLLNQDLHLSLMETFENHDPDHLRLCLRIILDVLERLGEREEEEILDKVLCSMEELKFKIYLEELVKERHDSTIESHLCEILDTYYSEEIQ